MSSESSPLLGPKKKEKRKKGSRPRFEELTDPCSSKGWLIFTHTHCQLGENW